MFFNKKPKTEVPVMTSVAVMEPKPAPVDTRDVFQKHSDERKDNAALAARQTIVFQNAEFGELTKKAATGLKTSAPLSTHIEALDQALMAISSISEDVLPIELTNVKKQKQILMSKEVAKFLDKNCDRISLDILKWRKKDKTPVFGVFDPFDTSGKCTIGPESRSAYFGAGPLYVKTGKNRQVALETFYADLDGMEHCLCAEFNGLIPTEVRKRIMQLSKLCGIYGNIEIIAECDWKKKAVPIIDPLVILRQWHTAWLVAAFDLTPIERIASSEFTSAAAPRPVGIEQGTGFDWDVNN